MKNVFITGASRGIGRAIALEFAANGYHVIANYKASTEKSEELKSHIQKKGGSCELSGFDVSDCSQVRTNIEKVLDKHKTIDVLVNNAGISMDNLFLEMSDKEWLSVIETNLSGMFFVTRLLLKPMFMAKKGKVINITSITGQAGNAGQVNYAASKAGIIGFTKALAKEVGKKGINVNAISPGIIDTDMSAGKVPDDIKKFVPLKRIGKPEEVAKVAAFLASEDASYITGQVIAVNGGLYM